MNTKQARYLHRMLDRLAEGKSLYQHEIEDLRKSLPETPAQKTLEELRREVYDAWAGTSGNEWPDDIHGDLDTWLEELHEQLRGLVLVQPEFLGTEEDYERAPEGTIVVQPAMRPWFKEDDDHWSCGGGAGDDHSMFTTGTHRVLRWGKE